MTPIRLIPLAAALALALGACGQRGTDTPAATDQGKASAKQLTLGQLRLTPCSLPSPQPNGQALEAQCITFEVPEDRSNPTGRQIALNIAWVPPRNNSDPAPDPVFYLAGGPGQSAVSTFPALAPFLRDVLKDRGVMLVDQRGTGKSNLLNCQQDDDDASAVDFDPARARAQMQVCMEALSANADLRHYTTSDAIADLDAVRQAMGADKINLIGISYGTRVAQQYALNYPDHTRTITLDSPVPNTLGLGNIFARNLDDALAAQFALCIQNDACKQRMGDPRAELQSLLQKLRAAPVEVRYRDASSGEEKTGMLSADTVAGLVRMYAYMPAAGALLPQLIRDANQGRYASLMALAGMLKDEMQDSMAMGMQMSVICSEDAESMVTRTEDHDTVLGNRMVEGMAAMCDIWPKGQKPANFNTALGGNLPVLILTGEFDPVTPPKYGEEIVKTLPNGRWFNLKGQGHSVLGAGCMPKLLAQFIEKADATALDAKCLDTLAQVPPFTTYNGWEP